MSDELSLIENDIKKLTGTEFGQKHSIILKISKLNEIPINSFNELRDLMLKGKAIMRQYPLSTGSGIFSLISTKSEKRLFSITSYLAIISTIAPVILGFLFSWWYLLLFFLPIVFTRLGKRIYLRSIFNRAGNSEIAFCFLFCGKYITIELPGQGIIKRA